MGCLDPSLIYDKADLAYLDPIWTPFDPNLTPFQGSGPRNDPNLDPSGGDLIYDKADPEVGTP